MSQKDKLCNLLEDGKPHRTDEIMRVCYGGEHLGLARVGARIWDLKNKSKKSKKTNRRMSQKHYTVFLAYYGMGAKRSLDKLHQQFTELLPKYEGKIPVLETLKNWSRWFSWQSLVQEMDEETNKKLYQEAIEAAKETRVDILKLFRAVVLKFATQLKDSEKEINSFDIAAFWKMARIEMGLPADNSKQIHELGDSFFDLMKIRHDKWDKRNSKDKLGTS